MLSFLLLSWWLCGVLVHGVPYPIAPGGVTAGVPCSIVSYTTTEVVNITASDPNQGWRLVNDRECVTTSTETCSLTNENGVSYTVSVGLDFGAGPAFDLGEALDLGLSFGIGVDVAKTTETSSAETVGCPQPTIAGETCECGLISQTVLLRSLGYTSNNGVAACGSSLGPTPFNVTAPQVGEDGGVIIAFMACKTSRSNCAAAKYLPDCDGNE